MKKNKLLKKIFGVIQFAKYANAFVVAIIAFIGVFWGVDNNILGWASTSLVGFLALNKLFLVFHLV